MNEPTELTVQDVRCFGGEQTGAIRPITLLVGENSTGKTTFLACYRVLSRIFSSEYGGMLEMSPDFNEDPFFMGSFRDVVRSRRGRQGRIDEFRIGTSFVAEGGSPLELSIAFSEKGSQPAVSAIRWSFPRDGFLDVRPADSGTKWRTPTDDIVAADLPIQLIPFVDSGEVEPESERGAITRYLGQFLEEDQEYVEFSQVLPTFPSVVPVAPLRSKPERTYNPLREVATSDGEHVPMLMMRLDRTSGDDWNELRRGLVRFGRESGLFSDIRVRHFGRKTGDPFQLQVKVRTGSQANIMDVGYGVSQSLPILVDILAAKHLDGPGAFPRRGPHTFLLQQPEVHLHPRGQAELANLFVQSFQQIGNRFLIETHSDYIMDRVRILVRKKEIKPEDVSILYFEPTRNGVGIHSLSVDADGNLLDVPHGFREFFDIETDRLLGLRD